MSPSILSALNSPTELEYEDDQNTEDYTKWKREPLLREKGVVPLKIENLIAPRSQQWDIKEVIEDVLASLKKYHSSPSLPYRCPKLKGCLTPFMLLFLTFILKALYGFSIHNMTIDY